MSARIKLLAAVHLAKKELGLDDSAYRAVVMRITGCWSAGDANDAALRRLLTEFRRLGFGADKRETRGLVRLIYALWADIAPHLDGTPAEKRAALRGFVVRQTKSELAPAGIAAPEFLDAEQAKPVIEGLKNWRDRLRRGQAA